MTSDEKLPDTVEKLIDQCILLYEKVVKGVEHEATQSSDRAYGGIVRAQKGELVENISKKLIRASWLLNHRNDNALSLDKSKIKIPLQEKYIEKIDNKEIRDYIQKNIQNYFFNAGVDIHVYVDNEFILAVECKAFTENAMMKRIIFDASLLNIKFPNLRFALVQLESQLTGDYSELNEITYGSYSTHTLLSYAAIDVKIFTLLKGERHVKKAIHKPAYYKPLEKPQLRKIIKEMSLLLN